MSRFVYSLLLFCCFFFITSSQSFAFDVVATNSGTITATVPQLALTEPILVSPTNNSSSNDNTPTFTWQRPNPLPNSNLHHYDFYYDGSVFASGISDSVVSQDHYFYSVTGSSGTFTLTLKNSTPDGYHTWSVTVFDDVSQSSSSATWRFYIDSTAPNNAITKVETQTLNWSTSDMSTIPAESNRYLTTTNPDPTIYGTVETYANVQILLNCPLYVPTCVNQSWSGNSSNGSWQEGWFRI